MAELNIAKEQENLQFSNHFPCYTLMRKRVSEFASGISDSRIREMYLRCFYSTLDTTTKIMNDGTSYVFTGDIPAMWLRDSSVQVTGYLPYAAEDEDVRRLIKGLIKRQFNYIRIDPYSNAFNETCNGAGHKDDVTDFDSGWIWERKYEIDSLCYPFWLASKYYAATGDASIYDNDFAEVANIVIDLFITEQRHFENSKYYHLRPKYPQFPSLPNEGKGNPVGYTGMTWSGYRPSDDVCDYNYLVPSNMFAVVILKDLYEVFEKVIKCPQTAQKARKLATEIQSGIDKFGITEHPQFGKIYAFETDGLGNYNFMDDANVPSLLSLPYLGYCSADDPIYVNTRKFVLSKYNPYYYEGKAAKGVGSPHTPDKYIWHIALVIQFLTATDKKEAKECFDYLINTDGGCGVMHESFHKDKPSEFTREWFAWANTLFAIALPKAKSLMLV